MYEIYVDDILIYGGEFQNEYGFHDIKLKFEENTSHSFEFKTIKLFEFRPLASKLEIYMVDGRKRLIFLGRIIDLYTIGLSYHFTCEGELGRFNDSFVHFEEDTSVSIEEVLDKVIESQNGMVKLETLRTNKSEDDEKEFILGHVDTSNTLIECKAGYEKSYTLLEKIVQTAGGFIDLNYKTLQLQYYLERSRLASQAIELGENLLEDKIKYNYMDVKTVIVGIGDGITAYYMSPKIEQYGVIVEVVKFETNSQEELQKLTESYGKNVESPIYSVEVNAVDLSYIDSSVKRFKLGEQVRLLIPHKNIDLLMRITSMEIDLQNPVENKFTFGRKTEKLSEEKEKTAVTQATPQGFVRDKIVDEVTGKIYTIKGVIIDGKLEWIKEEVVEDGN